VEIVTQSSAEPRIDWLKIASTAGARSKIRKWLKVKGYAESVALGRDMLERQFKKARKSLPPEKELDDIAQSFGRRDSEHLQFSIGCGEISGQQVFNKVHPSQAKTLQIKRPVTRRHAPSGVTVQGMGNIMIRFAKCCQPVPGDDVVGLVTKGRGISIHRATCHNAMKEDLDSERLMEIDWDTSTDEAFPAELSLLCEDRHNLLADLAKVISDENANIINADVRNSGALCVGTFAVQVKNLRQLDGVIRAITRVKGVHNVVRKGEVVAE
jgi:GTP pyrophosphokinase